MRATVLFPSLLACVGLLLAGCELIVDFDRTAIPVPPAPDAAVEVDAAVGSGDTPDAGFAIPDGGGEVPDAG